MKALYPQTKKSQAPRISSYGTTLKHIVINVLKTKDKEIHLTSSWREVGGHITYKEP